MCGIAGFVGSTDCHRNINRNTILSSISHRGSDGCGTITIHGQNGSAFFAHSRLSIIDTSPAGAQPMAICGKCSAPQVAITYNGEIFNFVEIKKDLLTLGFSFKGGSDTEVILQAYRAWGVDSFSRFRGMFAFALADAERNLVFLVRDHLGIKPLYVMTGQHCGISFASEIRTFQFLPGSENTRRISSDTLHGFLAQGMVIGYGAFVEGVEEVNPGQCLVLDFSGKKKSSTFFTKQKERDQSWNWNDRKYAVNLIRKSLKLSVERHLIADVPVGIFLSAGIDSTALATIASESHSDLRTVSIGFDQEDTDESVVAARIAKHLGIRNDVVKLQANFIISNFDSVFSAMDQPTVDGFNTFFVCKAANELGLKVALSGLGGDELFGGYASFRDVPRALKISKLTRIAGIGKLISIFGKLMRSRFLWKGGRTGFYPSNFVGMYLLRRELFSTEDRLDLIGMPSKEIEPVTGAPFHLLDELSNQISTLDPENAVAILEQKIYMRNMLLRDSDVFSMVNGIEIRVPFLDQDLLGLVNSMPGFWKRPGPKPKALLVDAVGPRFPLGIQDRKKRGFSFPWGLWFRGPMREFARERLHSSTWNKLQISKTKIDKIWRRFEVKDPTVTALHILALVCLAELVERQRISL